MVDLFRSGDALFFGTDNVGLVEALYAKADAALGALVVCYTPADGDALTRVATVKVELVDDPATYVAKVPVEKPAVGRAPDVEPGKSTMQSLVFDKEHFTTASEVRQWIKAHPDFGDYGVEETGTSFRARQYDPEHFSTFRMMPFAPGVSGVLGIVKACAPKSPEGAPKPREHKALADTLVTLGLLAGSATIHKAGEVEGEVEERYILGLVLEPTDGTDGAPLKPDTQGDVYSAADIRRTAHKWMASYGEIDLNHSFKALGDDAVAPVESFIAPADLDIGGQKVLKGSWLLGLIVKSDKLWAAIKAGQIGAYSIGGSGLREPFDPSSPQEPGGTSNE
jgi:hypothetical protein